jgi:hypothetical protein
MGLDGRSQRNFPKHWTGLTAAGTSQATAFLLDNGVYHEFTSVSSGQGAVLPKPVELPREITISNNGTNTLSVYPQVGGTIDNGTPNASVALTAGSSVTYWPTSFTNWQSRVTGGSGGGGGGSTTITEVSQTASFTASANSFYAISGSANVTATLPNAAGIAGQTIRIRCVSGYTGLCTITGTGGQTIGGHASRIIFVGESPLLQSDGSNWVRTGGTIIPAACSINPSGTQSILASTLTVIAFNTTVYDNMGQMAVIASNEVKIPRPGLYSISASAYFDGLAAQEYSFIADIKQNGTANGVTSRTLLPIATGALATNVSLTPNGAVACAAGDLITVTAAHFNTANSAATLFQGPYTFLTVTEIPQW